MKENKLPEGWEEVNLLKYVDVVKAGVKEYSGIKKYIATGDLETGKILGYTEYDYESKPSRANMKVEINDVMFAKMKDTEKLFLITEKEKDYLFSTGFSILRIKDYNKFIPKFLYYYIKSDLFQNLKNKNCNGGTQKALNETKLKTFSLLRPPIETQKKIVETLDLIEEARTLRKETDEQSKEYLNAVFYEMFGDPVLNKKGWDMKKAEQLVIKHKNAIKAGPFGSSLKKEFYVPKGYKIYGQEQVIKDDFNYGDYYIDEDRYKKLESCKISEGDVLISLVGSYGNISIVPKEFEPGIINPRLMKISFDKNKFNPMYFKFLMNLENMKHKIQGLTHGGTMGILNVGIIKKLEYPSPPITLQNKFAEIVEQFEEMKKHQEISKQNLEDLYNSTMQKAFRGELK